MVGATFFEDDVTFAALAEVAAVVTKKQNTSMLLCVNEELKTDLGALLLTRFLHFLVVDVLS